jgi:hypothetical protein
MQGEIGTLNQGKQIGGFYDWSIDLNLTRTETPTGRVHKVSAIKASAKRYFFLIEPAEGEITANFYQLIKDKLVLMASHKVVLNKGEMVWMG